MEKLYEDNSYNNYSILSTNLTSGSNKFKNIYRRSSPVEIQSFGKNNFVLETKYKSKIDNNNNDEYDYIENELKRSKKNKAFTTYTQISNEDNLYFYQKNQPNQRYYRDYTNFDNYSPDYIYKTIDKNDKNNRQKIFKKEELNGLFYPSEKIEKIYIPKRNINRTNRHKNELQYQRFSASFISKSPDKKTNFSRSPIKKNLQNILNKKLVTEKKDNDDRSISKTKNQLEDFNIDKLKEIGDNLAIRFKPIKINIKNRKSPYIINNRGKTEMNSEKKNFGIINKIIMIDRNRRDSKKHLNLMNQSNNQILSKRIRNSYEENDKKYETRTLNDYNYNINDNSSTNRKKILKMSKKEIERLKDCSSPKKITMKDIIRKRKFNLKANSNTNIEIVEGYNRNLENIKNNNFDRKEKCNTNITNNNKIYHKLNNKIYIIVKNDKNEQNDKNDRKKYSINTNSVYNKVIVEKNKDNQKMKPKNFNHNYLESINIKSSRNSKKTQHSFNNIFLPLQ